MFQILVVEDDRDLNKSVCSFLNQSGYVATGCLSAAEAYDAMYEKMFDLIVSDIMMPGTDGFEFARTVRELNQDIPIFFMTARDDLVSKQRGFRIGVDDYMVKPIDLDELFLRIDALLRRAKIAASRKLEVGAFTMDADEFVAQLNGEYQPDQAGVQYPLQAALLPQKDLHPAAADGGILGRGHRDRTPGRGCVHDQAAAKTRRLPGF